MKAMKANAFWIPEKNLRIDDRCASESSREDEISQTRRAIENTGRSFEP
jgi:hypothetical protein